MLCRIPSIPGDYPALYSNLYEAITTNDPSKLAIKPEEAVVVLKLIELAKKSSREAQVMNVDF
jgi:scyllo-inositol 2-dehydrogenase (NADP+)